MSEFPTLSNFGIKFIFFICIILYSVWLPRHGASHLMKPPRHGRASSHKLEVNSEFTLSQRWKSCRRGGRQRGRRFNCSLMLPTMKTTARLGEKGRREKIFWESIKETFPVSVSWNENKTLLSLGDTKMAGRWETETASSVSDTGEGGVVFNRKFQISTRFWSGVLSAVLSLLPLAPSAFQQTYGCSYKVRVCWVLRSKKMDLHCSAWSRTLIIHSQRD